MAIPCHKISQINQMRRIASADGSARSQSRKPQLDFDGLLDALHVGLGDSPFLILKADLTYRRQLVGHCLVLLPSDLHIRFAGIESFHVGGERHNLNPVEMFVGGIVAYDHGRAFLAYLAANRRLEADPPDLTAFHRPHPPLWPRSIPMPRPRVFRPGPFACRRLPSLCRGCRAEPMTR